MKKYLAVVLAVVMAVACCAVLAGCTQPVTTTGSYHYENPWAAGTYYGCEATVTVKGDTIESVVISEDSATGWTNLSAGWTDKGIYEAAAEDYIAGFAGEAVEDVLAAEVELNAKGVPQSVTEAYLVAGATQTSGRVVLAIQSALGKHTSVGSYKYENPWAAGSYYGCAVKVVVVDGTIESVSVFSDEATGWTNLSAGWTDKGIYEAAAEDYIAGFAGEAVEDVLAAEVELNAKGVPQSVTEAYLVAGATQTSGRVVLAIQSALGKHTAVGSYHYENPWAAGSYYGCAVKVVTNANGKITSVSVFSDEATGWTNLSAGWGDRQIYIDGETAFIASFANANISDVLGIAVTVNASGVPQTLGTTTHVVTGATQTCGRVILAVQSALGRQNLVTPE